MAPATCVSTTLGMLRQWSVPLCDACTEACATKMREEAGTVSSIGVELPGLGAAAHDQNAVLWAIPPNTTYHCIACIRVLGVCAM